jgi:DNA replicative helicase MCM subunit Mcm2 (Cdc46/Mcm family)
LSKKAETAMEGSAKVVRQEFTPRKSLRDEGIGKILGEGLSPQSMRVTIEHSKGDKKPILIEIRDGKWYGDVRSKFATDAEMYFTTHIVVELEREIGGIVVNLVDEIIKDQERKAAEEVKLRQQQIAAAQIANDPQGLEHIERLEGQLPETESIAAAVGDWRRPISVKHANFARPNTIITVYGQIVAKGKLHSMIRGGNYRCGRCNGIQYIEYTRPSYPTDEEAPDTMRQMCRFCEEDNLEQGSQDYQRASTLHRVGMEDVRTVDIELMDTEAYDSVDTLTVKLFDKHAKDVKVGEYAIIRGKFYLVASSRNRRLYRGVLYAHDIKYTHQEEDREPTPEEVARVKRFVELTTKERPVVIIDEKTGKKKLGEPLGENNILNRLVFGYSRHRIVWNERIKEGLMYAETSAGPDVIGKNSENERRKRIQLGIVGNPGTGKSKKARSVSKHSQRNRYESAQGGSGKSFTAIVSKEGDQATPILRIGPLAHAKEAVIVMNELGEVPLEEQVHFQDAMEEGVFSIVRYGIQGTIRADAVVIWTANPKQGASFGDIISLDQMSNIRKQIIDRTDLLIVDKPIKDPKKRREFNHLRMELEKIEQNEPTRWKILCNYDKYVALHIEVARRLARKNGLPKLTDEASDILEEADNRIQQQKDRSDVPNVGSNRSLDTLLRLSTVIAMLKLKNKIEIVDAQHAVEFYNEVYQDIQASVVVPEDPATHTANTMLFILQNESNGAAMTLKTLAELASGRDTTIKWYLYQGPKNKLGNVSTNKRLRRVKEILGNISPKKIKQTNKEETEFMWVGGTEIEGSTDTNEGNIELGQYTGVDSGDSADRQKKVDGGQKQSTSPDVQTNMSPHQGTIEANQSPQTKKLGSAESARSAKDRNKPLEDNREYKILKAMEMAMADYNSEKAAGKESGALFERFNLWGHLSASLPEELWNVERVDQIVDEQVKKGRVIKRQGDKPGRYYLNWRDNNGNSNGGGNQ